MTKRVPVCKHGSEIPHPTKDGTMRCIPGLMDVFKPTKGATDAETSRQAAQAPPEAAQEVKPALTPEEWARTEKQEDRTVIVHMKPALTPDEWAGGETAWPIVALQTTKDGPVRVWDGITEAESESVEVPDKYRHALAALCLHDQLFGFTREDVEWLRLMVLDMKDLRAPANARKSADLADRIEALLPPHD